MSEAQKRAKKKYLLKNIRLKKHFCESCNKAFRDARTLRNHMNSGVHNPKPKVKYDCDICKYSTKMKSSMTKHIKTKKHNKNVIQHWKRRYKSVISQLS